MTFLGMVVGQIGTVFAARTTRVASLRSVGVLSNRLLLWAIAFELRLAAILIYAWGADELRRWLLRKRR